MSQTWVALTVKSKEVILIDLEFVDESTEIGILRLDKTIALQSECERYEAFRVIHKWIVDYLDENKIDNVVIQVPSVPRPARQSHMETAELRGVVMLAAEHSKSTVHMQLKSITSRDFGKRNMDDYRTDDSFWSERVDGEAKLRRGSRNTALLIFARRKLLGDNT